MARNGDPACRQHEYDDGYFIYNTDQRTLDKLPSPRSLEEEVGVKDEARNLLSMALKTYLGDGGLSQASRSALENTVKAFEMRVFNDVEVEKIAEALNVDVKTVYYYLATVKIHLDYSERIHSDMAKEFVAKKDWICLQVLHYLRIGKQTDEIVRISQREPFSYHCSPGHETQFILDNNLRSKKVMDSDPPYVQWKKELSSEDVEEAKAKICALSISILHKIRRRKAQKANDTNANGVNAINDEMDT